MFKIAIYLTISIIFSHNIFAEQTFNNIIEKIEIVNYENGAAYVIIKGAQFTECQNHTNWCAIDFSLPSGNQMLSTVLAAKMANKKIGITSNSCWSTNYPRCWKVHLTE